MSDDIKRDFFVSIIVPCRNEKRFIEKSLDSVIASDYPKEKMEILIVDGMSNDGTREIIENYASRNNFIRILDNPKKIAPTAFNIGVKSAKGEIIMLINAHTIYKQDYISKCMSYLVRYNADNVGGVFVTLPANESMVAKAIAMAISHPFGIGNAYFRIGTMEPRYVDTAPFGCYRKEVFQKIGFFDEELIRNQDDEFNARLIKNGGKILLVPEIILYYHARESYRKLWNMYFQYGYFKPLVAKKVGGLSSWRQVIPPVFVGSLIILGPLSLVNRFLFFIFVFEVMVYTFLNFYFSLLLSVKNDLRFLPFLFTAFLVTHFSYGLGYLKGILDFLVFNKNRKSKLTDLPLTR
jgi:glycosyltransferase involved in cell wall biosynthesis